MPNLAKTIGILLTLLGILSFTLTGSASWTALIPAFFGIEGDGLDRIFPFDRAQGVQIAERPVDPDCYCFDPGKMPFDIGQFADFPLISLFCS